MWPGSVERWDRCSSGTIALGGFTTEDKPRLAIQGKARKDRKIMVNRTIKSFP